MGKCLFFQVPFSCLLLLMLFAALAHAEDKYGPDLTVPKLTAQETADAPSLYDGGPYPEWGAPCTNFTYHVTYSDSKGRPPAYMRIWHNGVWHDMAKVSGDYKTGARYEYYYVPDSGAQLFYYFEASNGAGKARAGIIDSPNQGPRLYTSKLDSNQIILLEKGSNAPVWVYETGKDVPSHVALSADGKYLAASTGDAAYLFSTSSNTPLWKYCLRCAEPPLPTSNFGGAAVSSDGSYVAAAIGGTLYYFGGGSNKSLWNASIESNAIGIDMSDDGQRIAVGVGNAGAQGDKIFFFSGSGEPLGEYKAAHPDYVQTGNFYRPDITPDGSYVAVSTGCPDRRAYLFTGEGRLAFRSEQLTEDSPAHKSAISDDASLIAYSLDHSPGKEIVMLFSKSGSKLWGFSSQEDATARAVSISADGSLIAAGTTAGHVYLFSKARGVPLWKFSAQSGTALNHIGDVKLSPDGKYLVAGGTGKKVYFFSTASAVPLWEHSAKEWINSVDYAAGYVAAATGMEEFAFEGNEAGPEKVSCSKIMQPPSRQEMDKYSVGGSGQQAPSGPSECGNGICESGGSENFNSCPNDCMQNPSDGIINTPARNGTQLPPMNGTGQAEPESGCIYDDCKGEIAGQKEGITNTSGGPAKANQSAGAKEPQQQPAVPLQEPTQEPKLPPCSGVLDSLWDFLSSLFGNRYCS